MFRSLPRIVCLISVVAYAASQYTGIVSYHCLEDDFKCEMDKNKIELRLRDEKIATLTTLIDEQRKRKYISFFKVNSLIVLSRDWFNLWRCFLQYEPWDFNFISGINLCISWPHWWLNDVLIHTETHLRHRLDKMIDHLLPLLQTVFKCIDLVLRMAFLYNSINNNF